MLKKTSSHFCSLALLISIGFTGASVSLFAADPTASAASATAAAPEQAVTDSLKKEPSPVEKKAVDSAEFAAAPLPADPSAAAAGVPLTAPVQTPRPQPSQNVTINLINRLVQRKVLSQEDATELIKQAEADAVVARAQAEVDAGAAAQAAMAQVAGSQPPASDDSMRVTYIPEVVKAQMRDEIKQEVMDQARDENWAAPRTLPEWTMRFRLLGDFRFRFEGSFFPDGNVTGFNSSNWNYNAINQSTTPYDISLINTSNQPPYRNVDQNRDRLRIRARLGTEVDLGDGFTAGLRFGSGDNSQPVSENQSLGAASSNQGGDFSKYAVWIDRAFLKYELWGEPERDFTAVVGRFDNPFFSTSMIWANDLAFDGMMVKGKYQVAKGVTPFLTMGGFPVFNTDLNFSSNQPTKFTSNDKWLLAIQAGTDWKINKDFNAKLGVAFYDFLNIEGHVSSPFTPVYPTDAGNTDDSRPSFAQTGNTYIALRDIVAGPLNNNGAINQWQYFGLATPFRELALTGRVDFNRFDPFHMSLTGEFVKNVAFNRGAINQNGPPNLIGPVNNNNSSGVFGGGDTAWMLTLTMGRAALEKRWDWNISVGYRYVESDAVVDGLCDADFGGANGGGGTNFKGFTLGGALALSPRVWVALTWMSADGIAGPAYHNDLIQFDINAKF